MIEIIWLFLDPNCRHHKQLFNLLRELQGVVTGNHPAERMAKQEELLTVLAKIVDLGPIIDGFREEFSCCLKACKAEVLRPSGSPHSE